MLARILVERGLYDTPLGVLAMGSAAGDDLMTCVVVAFVIAVVLGAVLIPVFFVITGFNVDLSSIGLGGLGEFVLILAAACGGKILGVGLAARAHRLPKRESLALAVLMNTRGLTELIVLNLGLDLALLSSERFSLMVLMAVTTTVITAPLLSTIKPDPTLIGSES